MREKNRKNRKQSNYWLVVIKLPHMLQNQQYLYFQQLNFDLKIHYSFGYTEVYHGKIYLKFYCYFIQKQQQNTLKEVIGKSRIIMLDSNSKVQNKFLMIDPDELFAGPWQNGTMTDQCQKLLRKIKIHAHYARFIKICDNKEIEKKSFLDKGKVTILTKNQESGPKYDRLKIYYKPNEHKKQTPDQNQEPQKILSKKFQQYDLIQSESVRYKERAKFQKNMYIIYPGYITQQDQTPQLLRKFSKEFQNIPQSKQFQISELPYFIKQPIDII